MFTSRRPERIVRDSLEVIDVFEFGRLASKTQEYMNQQLLDLELIKRPCKTSKKKVGKKKGGQPSFVKMEERDETENYETEDTPEKELAQQKEIDQENTEMDVGGSQ